MHCVFFFGTHDYAWITDTDIKPYQEFKDKLNTKKSASFRGAIAEIEEYIKTGKWTAAAPVAAAAPAAEEEDEEEGDAEFDALFGNKPAKKTPAKTAAPPRRRGTARARTTAGRRRRP